VSPASFTAEVLSAGGGGHAVVVPKEIAATFSSKRPRVIARVNGVEYHSRLMVYGGTCYLGLRKDLLRTIQRGSGEPVEIALVEDAEPPPAAVTVTEPAELVEALARSPEAATAYQALPPSHRQEYARWINEAAKPETRAARVARTVRRLSGS
jgi:hypothetical protein